ncbi:MAG: J domain-containing protein [Verrucomicrobia bacterium]|nr:J domain-containing protein [Verrucomicrobiota bacterium]
MDERQISAHLELFDLPDTFTEAQLKQAYHDLVQVWHPDKHAHNERLRQQADEKMKEINQAYQVLQSCLINGMFRFERSTSRPEAQAFRTGPTANHQPAPETHTPAAESDPQDSPHTAAASGEPKGLRGNALWYLLLGVMLLIVLLAPRGRKATTPNTPETTAPEGDAEPLLFSSIEGPQTGTNTAPMPLSKALDSKYGFKDLKLGLSIDDAGRRLRPDRITTNLINQLVIFWYGPGPANKLGDFPLDYINASFFHDQLFKIEVGFSSNQSGMLDALRDLFGASSPNDSLSRDSAPLRAECWFGEKTFCAIVAPRNSDRQTGWDAMVMYDQALNRAAQQYAAGEPTRAAQALREDGFGEFKFGMTLKEFSRKLRRPPTVSETGIGQSAAVVTSPQDSKLGRYSLSSVKASFFQDKLYRIDLDFEAHQKEIYEGFMNRFPTAADDDTWSRNGESLHTKQYAGQRLIAAILAPRSSNPQWDSIILYDRQIDERRRAFEHEAPARAAKDL